MCRIDRIDRIDRIRHASLIQSASGKHRDWLESAAAGDLLIILTIGRSSSTDTGCCLIKVLTDLGKGGRSVFL